LMASCRRIPRHSPIASMDWCCAQCPGDMASKPRQGRSYFLHDLRVS
jgi:hypothetical protein